MRVSVELCRSGEAHQSSVNRLLVPSRYWWSRWDVVAAGEVVAVWRLVAVSVPGGLFNELLIVRQGRCWWLCGWRWCNFWSETHTRRVSMLLWVIFKTTGFRHVLKLRLFKTIGFRPPFCFSTFSCAQCDSLKGFAAIITR